MSQQNRPRAYWGARKFWAPGTVVQGAISSRQLLVAHPLEHIRECRAQRFALLECKGKIILKPVHLRATVMIGMGERTTPQAVLWIARSLFRAGSAKQVLAVLLPKSRTTCTWTL